MGLYTDTPFFGSKLFKLLVVDGASSSLLILLQHWILLLLRGSFENKCWEKSGVEREEEEEEEEEEGRKRLVVQTGDDKAINVAMAVSQSVLFVWICGRDKESGKVD